MSILGRSDEAERHHEVAELGNGAEAPGPVRTLCETKNLAALQRAYGAALSDLSVKVSGMRPGDPKLPYYRTLLVLTKKVELDLQAQIDGLTRFFLELDE